MHGVESGNRSWRRMGDSEIMVSNDGLITGRKITKLNYCTFTFKKTYYVHRVVYELFVGPIPKGYDINHIDGNKFNNNVCNLEAVTRSENQNHAFRTGLNKPHIEMGEGNPNYRNGAWLKMKRYGKAWHIAKKKGLDWKSLSVKERLALLPELDNGATYEIVKA